MKASRQPHNDVSVCPDSIGDMNLKERDLVLVGTVFPQYICMLLTPLTSLSFYGREREREHGLFFNMGIS